MGRLTFQLKDHNGDLAQTSVPLQDGVQATYDADVAAITALIGDINDITLGNLAFWAWEAERNEAEVGNAASPAAQSRYQAIAVSTDDVSGEEFRVRIPTPDHSLFTGNANGLSFLPLDAGAGLALKGTWEAVVQSPAGNAVTLELVYLRDNA